MDESPASHSRFLTILTLLGADLTRFFGHSGGSEGVSQGSRKNVSKCTRPVPFARFLENRFLEHDLPNARAIAPSVTGNSPRCRRSVARLNVFLNQFGAPMKIVV
jgi:hypothetical protein